MIRILKQPVTRFVQAISLLSDERDAREIKQMIDDIKGLTYGEIEHMAYLIDAEIEVYSKENEGSEFIVKLKVFD